MFCLFRSFYEFIGIVSETKPVNLAPSVAYRYINASHYYVRTLTLPNTTLAGRLLVWEVLDILDVVPGTSFSRLAAGICSSFPA
jgi:hypothetical protein